MTRCSLGPPGGGLSATAQVMVFGGVLEHVVDRSEHRARRLTAGAKGIRTGGPTSSGAWCHDLRMRPGNAQGTSGVEQVQLCRFLFQMGLRVRIPLPPAVSLRIIGRSA